MEVTVMECECDRNHLHRDLPRQQGQSAISILQVTKERLISATQDAEHETWKAPSFGALEYLSLTPASAAWHRSSTTRVKIEVDFFHELPLWEISSRNHPKVVPGKAKRPPGNRVASSLGRIVPTEAKPSELSGEILSLAKSGVKAKTCPP
jgi:hypothetical protein